MISPSVDVSDRPGKFPGSITYDIPVTQGKRNVILSGGSRLMNELQALDLENYAGIGPVKVKVTAHGKAGTIERDWSLERVE